MWSRRPCHLGIQHSYLHWPGPLKVSFNPKEDDLSGPSPSCWHLWAVSIPRVWGRWSDVVTSVKRSHAFSFPGVLSQMLGRESNQDYWRPSPHLVCLWILHHTECWLLGLEPSVLRVRAAVTGALVPGIAQHRACLSRNHCPSTETCPSSSTRT